MVNIRVCKEYESLIIIAIAHALSSVTEQAKLIASWSDGYPLIAIKTNDKDGDASVIALNMVAGLLYK